MELEDQREREKRAFVFLDEGKREGVLEREREREKLSDVECHGPEDGIKSVRVTGNSERWAAAVDSLSLSAAARNTGSPGPTLILSLSLSLMVNSVKK